MPTATPLEERFWPKVKVGEPDECWEWQAYRDRHGYGKIGSGGKRGQILLAHRVAYELAIGPIPDGLTIDHLCRNPSCINPDHLEPVTQGENVRRGDAGAHYSRRTHCANGHPFAGDNLHKTATQRRCRACDREWSRAYRRRKAKA